MADYFTSFSCCLNVGTVDNAHHSLGLCGEMADALERDGCVIGFELHTDAAEPSSLFISDEDGYGEPEHVIAFVLRCAEAFDLSGRWGFAWALTCSRPRLDGFGGGAQVLDLGQRKSVGWIDCEHWLLAALDPESVPDSGVAESAQIGGVSAVG